MSWRAGRQTHIQAGWFAFVFVLCVCQWGCSREDPRAATAASTQPGTSAKSAVAVADRTFRILHVMSYHSPWDWTDGQLAGFKEALAGLRVEYKVFQMDAKRRSSEEHKLAAAREACALIEDWKPDLVYISDEAAAEHVAGKYLNTALPFVFSGVSGEPPTYGFDKAANVTGALEREHFTETIRLLQQLVPGVRKMGVVLDEDPHWQAITERVRKRSSEVPGTEFVSWETPRTFAEYQALMRRYEQEKEVDAVLMIGIFTFKGADGKNVPYQDVQRWTAENVRIPDCSFWMDRVSHGTLCSMTVAAREQGLAAGAMAREILVEGKRPCDIPMRPTAKGEPCISLPRAKALGLKITSSALLSSRVMEKYLWER